MCGQKLHRHVFELLFVAKWRYARLFLWFFSSYLLVYFVGGERRKESYPIRSPYFLPRNILPRVMAHWECLPQLPTCLSLPCHILKKNISEKTTAYFSWKPSLQYHWRVENCVPLKVRLEKIPRETFMCLLMQRMIQSICHLSDKLYLRNTLNIHPIALDV